MEPNDTMDVNSTTNSLIGFALVPHWLVSGVVGFIVIAITLGIPGNILVLVVLTKYKLKTSTDWFIISIALCDLMSLCISAPIDILRYQPDIWLQIGNAGLCKFHYYVVYTLFIESNFLILFVGVDRFLKTCRPHAQYFTTDRAFWFCIGVTIGSVMLAMPSIYTSTALKSGICIFDKPYVKLRMIFITCLIIIISISLFLLVLMYGGIAHLLKRRAYADRMRRENMGRILRTGCRNVFADPEPTSSYRTMTPKDGSSNNALVTGTVLMDATNQPPSNRPSAVDEGTAKQHTTSFCNIVNQFTKRNDTKIYPGEIPSNEGTDNPRTPASQRRDTAAVMTTDNDQSKRAKKTTKIMFAITSLFMISSVIPTGTAPFLTETNIRNYAAGQSVIFLFLRLYTISNFANPLLYMVMSSTFRKRAMMIIKRRTPG